MRGANIAVFGSGRSGLAIAAAALNSGARPVIYDERPAANLQSDLPCRLVAGFDGKWPTETDLIVASPGIRKNHPSLQDAVRSGLPVISEIEFAYRIAKAPILAITGTNGKSTTTVMAYLCLLAAGVDGVLCGNIYGSGYPEMPLTEAAAASNPNQVLVAEISSFQLEWIETFRPSAATITNIAEDHLDRHHSFSEYRESKLRIYENMGEGDTAVWRLNDELTKPPNRPALRIETYGSPEADAAIEGDCLRVKGVRIEVDSLPFTGAHNLSNALAAVLLAGACTTTPAYGLLLRGLAEFRGLAHRMEPVGERDGVLIINNSMCTNPAAVVASSKGLDRRQHILIGGIEKGTDFSILAEYLEATAHQVYAYGRDAEQIVRQLGGRWPVFNTLREAFEAAARRAAKGEAIMLAPGAASMDQFKDFRDRGEAFSAMAKEWLES